MGPFKSKKSQKPQPVTGMLRELNSYVKIHILVSIVVGNF